MAEKYDMGTALGGERKSKRMHSPLDEMDCEVPLPTTPIAAYAMVPPMPNSGSGEAPITMSALRDLFDEKVR